MSSLVVISRLDATPRSDLPDLRLRPCYDTIIDIGFSEAPGEALTCRPPRPATVPYDAQCQDRFLSVGTSDSSASIGRVTLDEAWVNDTCMRQEVEFTGFRLSLNLRHDVYQAYLDYVGSIQERGGWDGTIRFRVPSAPFGFPMPCGSSKPWVTRSRVVRPLKHIRHFDFNEITIEALGREPKGHEESGATQTATELPPAPALIVRAARSSAQRLADRFLRLRQSRYVPHQLAG